MSKRVAVDGQPRGRAVLRLESEVKKTIVQRIDALQAKLSRRTTELKTMQQELDDLKLLFVQGRERLEGAPICAGCGEDWPCSDSVAEAQVQADEEAERSLRARYNDLLVDHARLAAQVLRVRELRDRFATHEKSISYQAAATLLTRALDGDGPGCQGTPDKTESVVHAYEADTWRAPRLSTIGDDGGDA